ncbi:MAG TPA: hypothetical protein VJ208_03545 [Candidatus Nanoarchaeia archaeon]|nr:hypothetical protein [Candidatus Nanoarchaeia archaeon]
MSKMNFFLFIFFIFILLLLAWAFLNFANTKKIFYDDSICSDGSLKDTCSVRKPYFCSNGFLIEKSKTCGCPENFTIEGDSCISEFQTEPKNAALKYVLRGKEYEINYTVYRGMADYLSELPVFIKYDNNEFPSRVDFKLKNINEESQRNFLLPLVNEIQNRAYDKEEQARIAISIVQNIPWGFANKTTVFRGTELDYSRHPYEVLYDSEGVCGEKSELLAFLLREIGYGTVIFYNQEENHESVGVKCPVEESWRNSGYCFVETSGPAIMTDNSLEYVGGFILQSEPEILFISDGDSLPADIYEYEDARTFKEIKETINGDNFFVGLKKLFYFKKLQEKYGLVEKYNAG